MDENGVTEDDEDIPVGSMLAVAAVLIIGVACYFAGLLPAARP